MTITYDLSEPVKLDDCIVSYDTERSAIRVQCKACEWYAFTDAMEAVPLLMTQHKEIH